MLYFKVNFLKIPKRFFLIPIVLYFIFRPDFYEPSEQEKEEIDQFFDHLTRKKQNDSNENINKN